MPKVRLNETLPSINVRPAGTPGRFMVQLIDAGEGSSGVYSPETLKRAVTDKVFPAGTHMYIDHAASLRRGPSGERSIRDLAAVLAEDAVFNPDTNGIEAPVLVMSEYADTLEEMAPHIGVSISALAESSPPAPGQRKPTVKRIVMVESVDFVSKAGRGGKILSILESAHVEATAKDRRDQLDQAATDLYANPEQDVWVGVADFDDVSHTVWLYIGERLYQIGYTVADDDTSVTLTGDPVEVRQVTTYVPVTPAEVQADGVNETTTTQEEAHMANIPDAELAELRATAERVTTLESSLAEATQKATDAVTALEAERAERASERIASQITSAIETATQGQTDAFVARVRAVIEAQHLTDETTITPAVEMAVKAETDYLAAVTQAPRLAGFGQSSPTPASNNPQRRKTIWN